MAVPTNLALWDSLRKGYPQFATQTSKGTKDLFTTQGWEALKNTNPTAINDFFLLSMRVYLQLVNISHAVDPLENKGFGEYYDNPMGGYIQRMATYSIKPISPAYKNLTNGATVDPFVVRKPVTAERFFRQNFDYQSMITIPDDFAMKQIFISEFGMSEFMGGIMAGLNNGYTTQVYQNKLEALNAGINSTIYPLQVTQKVTVPMSATPTSTELVGLIFAINELISAMEIAPQTSNFNAIKFSSTQDTSRLKLLIRPTYMNLIKTGVMPNAFNQQFLNLPIDVIEVENFGGLQAFKEATFTTPLFPVYSTLGEELGFTETSGGTTVTVQNDAVFWKDPNAGVIAVMADKGYIFNSMQNPYSVEPIRNPRGLYTNYWASSPNNTIATDPLYNIVVFRTN